MKNVVSQTDATKGNATAQPVNNQPKLRVWWIPQVPMKPFLVPVRNIREAQLVLDALARYDRFQFENNIKPDYCNAGGLSYFDEGENDWLDWEDDDGNNIDHTEGGYLSTAV